MSKKTSESQDYEIPVLSDIVSTVDTDNDQIVEPIPPSISASRAARPPLNKDNTQTSVDFAKLEKLIAQKLQKRFKELSKEFAAEIVSDLKNTPTKK